MQELPPRAPRPAAEQPDAAPPPAGDAAVTGVARGALGTGTALDDTQEWIVPDDVRSQPVAALAAPDPVPDAAPPRPVSPAAADVVRPAVRRHTPAARATTSFAASPRAAGIAAAALLALIAVAAVVTSRDGARSTGSDGSVPAVTAAPTLAVPADAGGGGKGNGDGKDGNGKGHGNGNGNGHH